MRAKKRRTIAAALVLALALTAGFLWWPRSFSRLFRGLDRSADARLYATYYDPIVHPNGKVDSHSSLLDLEHGGGAVSELLDILDGYTYRHRLTGILERNTAHEYNWTVYVTSEDWSFTLRTNEYGLYQNGLDLEAAMPDGESLSLCCIAYGQDELIAGVNELLERYSAPEKEA